MTSPVVTGLPGNFQAPSREPTGLVRKVYEAYIRGREHPPSARLEAGRLTFLAEMEAQAALQLSRRELLFASRCKGVCDESRKAAIRNDVAGACRFLGLAELFSTSSQIGEEARLLCRAEITPAEAYLDYCCGHFEQSLHRVLQSMEIDEQLADLYGYTGLHAHRIHLLTRLVKLRARLDGVPKAMLLAANVFRYLAGTSDTVPAPGEWGAGRRDKLSPALLHFFGVQLAWEAAETLAGIESALVSSGFRMILDADAFAGASGFWRSTIYPWIAAKAASWGDFPAFTSNCATYLAQPGERIRTLWYSVAMDAVLACEAALPGESLTLRRVFAKDVEEMGSLPLSLRLAGKKIRARLDGASTKSTPGRTAT